MRIQILNTNSEYERQASDNELAVRPVGEMVLKTRAKASKRQSFGVAQTFILIIKKQSNAFTHTHTLEEYL
jgi:hypothetical protein